MLWWLFECDLIKRTSMSRKFDIYQDPQSFVLYTSLQIFNLLCYFLESVFVRSDGKWKTKIFYTQINDVTEYSKNCHHSKTTFVTQSWNSKTKTNAHIVLCNSIRNAMISVDNRFFFQHLSNKILKYVTVQCPIVSD